ncbi:metallophosphoesterase [Vogesella oryzae]|uniref:metallophosphoesterase n=1 Tax=Vogesella oryzae TaxID=1735285 RepID=UPI001C2E8F22|nr:metallophosphoesterase [Vogesella oryzae]
MNPNPSPNSPNSRIELYTHERMVNWLGPMQLLRTGLRSAVAVTLGAFADPREVQAALKPVATNPPVEVPADAEGGVWVDYLADTGDGWDSTYSMALCVSQDVRLREPALTLPRGRVLLLGGDQVYPTPADGGYRTRFLDPFRAASPAPVPANLPKDPDETVSVPDPRVIMAIPGNHDWYDGLRGFTQLFCNGKPVGDWETRQHTSYYALRLPGGWWVWGLDLQLESAIDRPQLEYFEQMKKLLQPSDRVVICTPEPSWVDEAERVAREKQKTLPSIETQTPRFRSLRDVEQLLGDKLAVVLAGDSHHYARYEPQAGTVAPQRITCGGGGAFLNGTHQLPDPPKPIAVAGVRQHYALKGVYPDKRTSERLRNRAWRLPTRNFSFCGVLAVLYLLFVWMVQSASKVPHPARGSLSLMEKLAQLEATWGHVGEAWHQLFWAMAHSPSSVVFALAIVAGCAALSASGVKRGTRLAFMVGAMHGLMHLGLAVGLLWLMGRVNLTYLGLGADDLHQVALFGLETLLLGGGFGGLLFGIWMVLTNALWGLHSEEVLSSQRIADHKCFLRMHFTPAGLTIYPLKLDKICRRWSLGHDVQQLARVKRTWRLRVAAGAAGPRFVSAEGQASPPESLQLIEPPIVIPR